MAMSNASFVSSFSCNCLLLILSLFFLIVSPSFCSIPSLSFKGLVAEKKVRLGSAPPGCHNKCNQCHPCTAVQVPTMPGRRRVEPIPLADSPVVNRYSNYKPLGWKCRCGGRFYNP